VRTRALKRSGPDLHGSVVIHATGSTDPVGASAADDDEPTVLEQPFTDTVESYSFDDCEDTFELERSLSPRTDDDWTSRAATPRERSSAEAAASLRRSQQQPMTPLASSTNTTTSLAPSSTTSLASSSSSSSSASLSATAAPPTPSYLYLVVVFAVLLVGALFEIARRDL
jgi:cobalamin biosynthesis Mg chelatase CobN